MAGSKGHDGDQDQEFIPKQSAAAEFASQFTDNEQALGFVTMAEETLVKQVKSHGLVKVGLTVSSGLALAFGAAHYITSSKSKPTKKKSSSKSAQQSSHDENSV